MNLKKMTFNDIERLIKGNELSYFNIYNSDINPVSYFSTKYYHEHQYDNINVDQKIRIMFIDIELYTEENMKLDLDSKKAEIPINCVTIIDSFTKNISTFYWLINKNMELFGIKHDPNFDYSKFIIDKQNKLKNDLINLSYIDDSYNIELSLYDNEKSLLTDLFLKIHQYDPDTLSGWNIDMFDMFYIYNRLCKLFGNIDAERLMSKFGKVEVKSDRVYITDYAITDLLYLYKPRDEGGLNLGNKQPQYSLDFISKAVLGIGKIEYKNKNIDLDDLYTSDPETFVLYNIVDAVLCLKLNDNLKHIELYNSIRRIMKTPISNSMIGSSALFDTFVFYKLIEEGKYVRSGINTEQSRSIENFPFPQHLYIKDKKGLVIQPSKISAKSFNNTISSFPGAYVKNPTPKVINNGSVIIDLDATSLYPSMILQSNISFDSYYGRILPTCTYKLLNILEQSIGKTKISDVIYQNIQSLILDYVDRESIDKKKENSGVLYYIILYLIQKLQDSKLNMDQIYNPSTTQESLVLKNILIPLIDVLNLIHPENLKYSKFAYDYFFLDTKEFIKLYNDMYILHNAGESNTYISKISIYDGIEFIKNYYLTLAGTLFLKHDVHTGLFANFLVEMGDMRKKYKDIRDSFKDVNPYEYNLNDNRQKSVKVIMNTTYGLYGMSNFRYSNQWLAQSITNNGQLMNKIAQYISEEYLKFKFRE